MCGAGLVGPTQPTDFVGWLARVGWVGFIDTAFGCAELGWWGQPSLRISWVGGRVGWVSPIEVGWVSSIDPRSEARSVGTEFVSTCRSRLSAHPYNKKYN